MQTDLEKVPKFENRELFQAVKFANEIVRCKECKYFRQFKDASGNGSCQSNHTFDGAFRETDFCSYGQRK